MLKLAYIILAHEDAHLVAEHVKLLMSADPTGHVVIHYDAGRPEREFAALAAELEAYPRAQLVSDRVKCEWGQFSLVEAAIRALRLIRTLSLDCDYVYLASSSCVPIKPIEKLKAFLRQSNGMEFIEAFPATWVRNGLREDRYSKYHWLSWRKHRRLFDISVFVQRMLRINRRVPAGLTIRFGSQWWCLTRETCFKIIEYIDRHRSAYRFFRLTWIPDEMFFSTMATAVAGQESIAQKNLTYFMFTPKGRPITFFDDHLELVQELPFFFARKISLTSRRLRQALAAVAAAPVDSDSSEMPLLDSARAKFKYDHHRSRNVDFARPGQIFYGGQAFSGWPSSLGSYPGVFAVLHGPPDITRVIGRQLEKATSATLLGRIFHPDKVDICATGDKFSGFQATDNKIRDFDRALYLARLLQRANGMPIVEMAPGDESYAEWFFHQCKNAIFIPCIPAFPADEDMCRLYWLLAAAAFPSSNSIRPYEMRTIESFAAVRPVIDGYIGRVFNAQHRQWTNDNIIQPTRSRRLLPIRWATHNGQRRPVDRWLAGKLHKEFGPAVLPLIQAVPAIEMELRAGAGRESLDKYPASWVRLFERYFSESDGNAWDMPTHDSFGGALTESDWLPDDLPEDGK